LSFPQASLGSFDDDGGGGVAGQGALNRIEAEINSPPCVWPNFQHHRQQRASESAAVGAGRRFVLAASRKLLLYGVASVSLSRGPKSSPGSFDFDIGHNLASGYDATRQIREAHRRDDCKGVRNPLIASDSAKGPFQANPYASASFASGSAV